MKVYGVVNSVIKSLLSIAGIFLGVCMAIKGDDIAYEYEICNNSALGTVKNYMVANTYVGDFYCLLGCVVVVVFTLLLFRNIEAMIGNIVEVSKEHMEYQLEYKKLKDLAASVQFMQKAESAKSEVNENERSMNFYDRSDGESDNLNDQKK